MVIPLVQLSVEIFFSYCGQCLVPVTWWASLEMPGAPFESEQICSNIKLQSDFPVCPWSFPWWVVPVVRLTVYPTDCQVSVCLLSVIIFPPLWRKCQFGVVLGSIGAICTLPGLWYSPVWAAAKSLLERADPKSTVGEGNVMGRWC